MAQQTISVTRYLNPGGGHAVVRFIDPGICGQRKTVLGNATQLFPDRGSKARKSSANPFREIWCVARLLSAFIDQGLGFKFGKR